VFSKNLSRRHLTNSQKAMVGVELEQHFARKGQGRRTDLQPSRRLAGKSRRDNEATERAAKIVGTSGRSISRAKRIKDKRPDLAKKIKAGEMSVSAADGIISADKATDKPKVTTKKKQPRWSGKRLRELNEAKRAGDNSDFNKLQREIAKSVQALEEFDLPDLDWDAGMNSDLFGFLFDDLIELDRWVLYAEAITAAHTDEMTKQRTRKNLEARRDHPNTGEFERKACIRALERLTDKRQLAEGA
jgi:hypothetical protein